MIGGVTATPPAQTQMEQITDQEESKEDLEKWAMSHSTSIEDVSNYDVTPNISSQVERQAQQQCHKRDKSWHIDPSSPNSPVDYTKLTFQRGK